MQGPIRSFSSGSTVSTTSSPSQGSSSPVTRAWLVKAAILLVVLWAIAGLLRFPILRTDESIEEPSVLQDENGAIRLPTPPSSPQAGGNRGGGGDVLEDRPKTTNEGSASSSKSKGNGEKHPGGNGGKSSTDSAAPTTIRVKKHDDRAAVIIENRPLENLIPLLLHFNSVLGPEWPVILYTTPTTSNTLALAAAFLRAVDDGRIEVRHLQPGTSFRSHHSVSLFLTDPWIWNDLVPYKKILLFQADSILCSQSSTRVEDFLEYDFIGAPIIKQFGEGFNGGLSLRNRELMLTVLGRHNFAGENSVPDSPQNLKFEDQWFYHRLVELSSEDDGDGPIAQVNLPDVATAKKFSVETIWENAPLGFHQPLRWQKDNLDKIMSFCPEVGMISGLSFFD